MISESPQPQSFSFEGREIPLLDGATVASALIEAGELSLRETREGTCRGVFCGMGVCQECLVSIDGKPGQRACLTPARAGAVVLRQPARPDLTQTSAEPVAQTDAEYNRTCDVLVIGGGPGGLAAASTAAEAGLDVVVLDERAKLGGQYFKQPAVPARAREDAQFAAGRALIERARASGAEIHNGAQVWGAFDLDDIRVLAPDGRWRYQARALILAPGAYERPLPLPGWTLPGVMTTGAAQTLWRGYGVAPGERVLISGNGPLNMQVAAELAKGGVEVVGLVELARPARPSRLPALMRMARSNAGLVRDGLRYRTTLARARVPVLYGSSVVRVEGDGRASTAVVMAFDAQGRPRAGSERRFTVDAVCMGFGFVPSTDVARMLGCQHEFFAETGQIVTSITELGRTTRDGVWLVGDGGGIKGAHHARAQGALAALDAVRVLRGAETPELTKQARTVTREAARHGRFQVALGQVFKAPNLQDELAEPDTLICRCEGVSRAAVEQSLNDGAGHVGAIKRVTRAGMGPCQGRYCTPAIAAMVARSTGQAPGELSGFAPTPPVKPVVISDLV
jgi:NADPH-dependent 2,4-dienoyl-CoA reductase/sulfur reductase-like enzyme